LADGENEFQHFVERSRLVGSVVAITMTRSKSPRVSVVGASGFVGRWLVEEVERLGWDVRQFNRVRPALIDRCLDPSVSASDVVFWLASSTNPAVASAMPELAEREFAEFNKFVSCMAEAESSALVVIASSGGTVYDATFPPPYSETAPLRAAHPYAALKLKMEGCIAQSPLRHSIVRMSNPYGPRQPAGRGQGVVGEWVRSISQGRPIPIIGSLATRRDFLFIEDTVRGLAEIASREVEGVVNLGSGTGSTLQEVLDHLVSMSPYAVKIERLPSRHYDVSSTWLAIDRILNETAWRPTVSLKSGLERTLNAELMLAGGM
jgi:UDP-glucose 4-epimerase